MASALVAFAILFSSRGALSHAHALYILYLHNDIPCPQKSITFSGNDVNVSIENIRNRKVSKNENYGHKGVLYIAVLQKN